MERLCRRGGVGFGFGRKGIVPVRRVLVEGMRLGVDVAIGVGVVGVDVGVRGSACTSASDFFG